MGKSSPNDSVGTLGNYTLVEKLGEGYLGPVYRGFDQDLGRAVVVRILCDGIKWDANLEELFHSECDAIVGLRHPNIASIYEVGREGQVHYIVMESLGSGSIQTLIVEKSPMPAEAKLSIMIQIVEGLAYAHRNGILHRALGPGKIHVTAEGNVKIRDFAVAHMLSRHLPHPVVRWGTPLYLSPEQIQQKGCDERSDIFSAGMVFYELLTYFHPFHDSNSNKALDNILLDTPIPTFERFPDVPPGIWILLKTCMARDPGDRYQSMDALLDACGDLQKSLAEDTQLMLAELYASLTPLKKAAEQPNASQNTIDLLEDIRKLSLGETKADYVSLDRLMTLLMEQYPLIQAASSAQDSANQAFQQKINEPYVSTEIEPTLLEVPVEDAEIPVLEQPDATEFASGNSASSHQRADAPQVFECAVQADVEGNPETARLHSYNVEPQQFYSDASVEPDAVALSATGLDEATDELSEQGLQNQLVRLEWPPRNTAPEIRHRTISRLSYRAAVILLAALIIAAAAYIAFGTEMPARFRNIWNLFLNNPQMSVNAAVPQIVPENTIEASLMDAIEEASSGANPFEEAALAASRASEAQQRTSSSEMAATQTRRRLKAKSDPVIPDQISEKERQEAARKERDDSWSRKLAELLEQGNYPQVGSALNLWLAESPGNLRAQEFNTKLEEIHSEMRILNSALSESRYQDALNALRRVEKINPTDPNLAELRKQIELRKASARASLTVQRLGPKAVLLFDGRQMGNNGEVQGESIPIGNHTVSIQSSGGLIASRSQEYLENQQVALVYDLTKLVLRPMAEGDQELLAQRKMMEEVHRFELEHEHGFFRGTCRGELSVDYYDVAYKPFSGQHGFRIPFKLLKISNVDGRSVDFSFVSDNKHFESFIFQDEQTVERFVRIWGDLKSILH
jgi:serine/threonine protein kinase